MPRTKSGTTTHKRHKKLLKQASGFYGSRHKIYSIAKDSVRKAYSYAFVGRKIKKRDFRALWIMRINAAARENGLSYSKFMGGLKSAGVSLDRRVLANLALNDPQGFAAVVEKAKAKL